MSRSNNKEFYVCGPLTELPKEDQKWVKMFYERIADVCKEITGIRAFVPHEHYDPIAHADYEPPEVDKAERHQVCECTSCLIVVAIAPSWGGGIEVEMAYRSNIPIILLCERKKLKEKKISRLLRGNPGVFVIIEYDTEQDALEKLRVNLTKALVPH